MYKKTDLHNNECFNDMQEGDSRLTPAGFNLMITSEVACEEPKLPHLNKRTWH